MKFLCISDSYPEYDRNSADFRLSQFLVSLQRHGSVHFWAIGVSRQESSSGVSETARYQQYLTSVGIQVQDGSLRQLLDREVYDAIVIEWYFSAAPLIDVIRFAQPNTLLLIDSVDVTFNRQWAKARISGKPEDHARAKAIQADELKTYRASDLVLTVSDEDAHILASLDGNIKTLTIPNIHPIHTPVDQQESGKTLVFVGSKSEANDDAMRFFCNDVLPRILAEEPETVFRAVGTVTKPPLIDHVARSIEWLGFVPETHPYLESSLISVAPLRFGGGMKGKVGEAMALGLPVVSTSTGAEGFGLVAGRDALVADDPADFARAVVFLLRDAGARERLRLAGWQFIRDHYSDSAVHKRVDTLVDRLHSMKAKPLSFRRMLIMRATTWWAKHIAWRLE